MNFEDEIRNYTIEELEIIVSTQKDLYTEEEMNQLKKLLALKRQVAYDERERNILERLPKEILCDKCDGPNSFSNETCVFCGHKLNKSKYYTDEYYEKLDVVDDESSDNSKDSYTFQYVISFIIPLVGFIVGGIMLANDDDEKRSHGKVCIVVGIVSILICAVCMGVYWSLLW